MRVALHLSHLLAAREKGPLFAGPMTFVRAGLRFRPPRRRAVGRFFLSPSGRASLYSRSVLRANPIVADRAAAGIRGVTDGPKPNAVR